MARSMMKSKGVPGRFWGEAVTTAVYLLNRAPTKSVVGMTPYEAWYGRKPSVDHLRTFGCVAHVKTVAGHTSKLADRSTPMIMIGYEAGSKAYRAYNPINKKLVVTRDVVFEEEKSWNWGSTEPVQSISNEIFTVVYSDSHADDQGTASHSVTDLGAGSEDVGPKASSSATAGDASYRSIERSEESPYGRSPEASSSDTGRARPEKPNDSPRGRHRAGSSSSLSASPGEASPTMEETNRGKNEARTVSLPASATVQAEDGPFTDDLIVEILSRLPARSIHRFKCVSPFWRDLIADPAHRRKLSQTLAGFLYDTYEATTA
ncbi:hypothetical protein QYE76_047414 [Lolium multiflorum]|uniref:F-box domain-containing protein n=1 Tax=Lolium multiflorum TaxID=4521 RepID=A0AAD8X1K6_LOLMU|nr:hypothetical protein QYE76_047414 [Lolium multiflorum]